MSLNRTKEEYNRMIIPIRCMGCGKLIADKWRWYQQELNKELAKQKALTKELPVELDGTEVIKTPEGELLKQLGMDKLCCRIHFLTHRDLIDKI